jgi:hypothetical protein
MADTAIYGRWVISALLAPASNRTGARAPVLLCWPADAAVQLTIDVVRLGATLAQTTCECPGPCFPAYSRTTLTPRPTAAAIPTRPTREE